MGNCRFLYDNYLISSTQINLTSMQPGMVTAGYKEGDGSASLNTIGIFTGEDSLEYVVEIDSTVAGNEVGQAEFKWRDGTDAWDGTTITTQNTTIALSNGIKISFTSGADHDFELGDAWYFKGIALWGPENLIDGDRNSRYHGATGASTSKIEMILSSAKEVKGFIIYDHNFTSSVTLTLKGDTSTAFAAFSTTLTWNNNNIIHFLSSAKTYQYWQLEISDPGSTLLSMSEIYLGSFWQPADNYSPDSQIPKQFYLKVNESPYGVKKNIYYNKLESFNINFPQMKSTEKDNFDSMLNSISNQASKKIKPFYFVPDSTILSEFYLVNINSYNRTKHFNNKNSINIAFEEVGKSV